MSLPACTSCGAPATAFKPGRDALRFAGILLARSAPDTARCLACWPAAHPPEQITADKPHAPEQ